MEKIDYFVVDAFADELFRGNPAGVCVLNQKLPNAIMQKIATENNLSETAFVMIQKNRIELRWFTPRFEIDLCGHATLASAFILFKYYYPEYSTISFETMSGILTVARHGDLFEMCFPKRSPKQIMVTDILQDALGIKPTALYSSRDLIVVLEHEQMVQDYIPNYEKLAELTDWLGIAITAKGTESDFVSRFFCPELCLEDPVTGSSHSSLVPLWAEKLGKTTFLAKQLSVRGGVLNCVMEKEQIKISGAAQLYLKGTIFLP